MKNNVHFSHYWTVLLRSITLLIGLTSVVNAQQYCTPVYNFVDCSTLQRRAYISNVSLNNRTFSTGCSQAGYAGLVNTNDPIVLTAGTSYNLTVNTYEYDSRTYTSTVNQMQYNAWIDYDRNGVFDNSEQIGLTSNSQITFNTRADMGGNYRLRIRIRGSANTLDPCTVQDFGETEDYTLRVLPTAPATNSPSYWPLCANQSITLSASGCSYGTIQWRDEKDSFVGNNPITFQLTKGVTYYAFCVVNGTASVRSNQVQIGPVNISPPSISSNNYNLVAGQSAALTAVGCQNGTITWSSGQTGTQITVTPAQTTTYTATCTQSQFYHGTFYCTSPSSNGATITVNAPSAPALTASKNQICPGESVVLSASSCAGTVKWSTGVLGSSITVSPSQQTDYSASCVINGLEGTAAKTTVSIIPQTNITTQPIPVAVCEGGQTNLRVDASGSGNLAYVWTRNGQALPDSSAKTSQLVLRNVGAANEGTYQVTVAGACGSIQSTSVALRVSSRMTATATPTPANCNGESSGALSVSVTGGLDAKQFRLKDSGDYQSVSSFNTLRAGTYTVQVRDAAGCIAETTGEVRQPSQITFKLTKPIDAKCAGGTDGAIDVEADGGSGGFLYAVNDGSPQTSGSFKNLKSNTLYSIKAIDSKGCVNTTNATVGAPNEINVSFKTKPTLCVDSNTGSLTVTASGGNGNYTYQLDQNTFQSANEFSALKAGTYSVAVKDGNGCEGKASNLIIQQPENLKVSATATPVNCRPGSATISVSSTGGTGVVRYQTGSATAVNNQFWGNIGVGSYTINATDANGCPATTTINVTKADTLLIQASIKAATCCTCPDGAVVVTSSGGTGAKLISISNGPQNVTSNRFESLRPDTYTVQVRDEVGCVAATRAVVSNATAITATLTAIKNVTCPGKRDGGATVQLAGGQKPFIYNWLPKTPADSLGNNVSTARLPEGEFMVSILDSNRCTAMVSGTLTAQNPTPPKPTVSTVGGNLLSSASTGVQWFTGNDLQTGKLISGATSATHTPYASGSYFAIATVNGCSSPASDVVAFVLTAFEQTAPLGMRIMPNPVSQKLVLEVDLPERESLTVTLFDATGRAVLNEQTRAFRGKQQIEWLVRHLPNGIYLLRGQAGQRQSVQRVVVQN